MTRKFNYEKGDYVKYEGNLSTLAHILRDPGYGRIEDFDTSFEQERIYLYLINKQQHIWCDFRDIRPIYTEPEHLSSLGFKTVEIGNRKKYELANVTVSGTVIITAKTTYLFQYCIGDLTNGVFNLNNYIENGELNLEKFVNNYPDVSNLNDLFIYLENQGLEVDKEKVVCS